MNELPGKIEAHLRTTPLAGSLTPLFCDTLRWGAPRGMPPQTLPGGQPVGGFLTAVPVAQLSGLPVFRIDWPEDRPPTVTDRRAVQRALARVHAEHLLCYVTRDGRQVSFVWPRKRPDGKTELRTLPYEVGSPARTTIDRLGELAFRLDELGPPGQPPINTIIEKLDAAFSVEAVTKLFYQEIANWYFWAGDSEEVVLPKDVETAEDRALFLIRLLTRLIFCWLLRKKRNPQTGEGLLPDVLFEEQNIRRLLQDASLEACTYYPAILQNLFFATLNTEMDKPGEHPSRRFINEGSGRRSDDHMIHTFWRNARLLRDPEAFAQMLRRVPFLNGGLFECLDERVQKGNSALTEEVRIDGFSNDSEKHPRLPNYLFFGPNRIEDLSSAYGDPGRRRATVRPLLSILRSYNFTLTENTPLDQEVALDPELLGHVFENLLAAYNPETGTVARKATGSFYTPRAVVDWMVDQALLIYLNKALARANNAATPDQADPRPRQLLSWDEAMPAFTRVETEMLIDAIDHLKVLDPACGSGAFPIGMLQKLVHVLRQLDPANRGWRRRQVAASEQIESPPAREDARRAIERAFGHDNDDYGRKLYLIEKCLYGVDIQPIACQIAKLRFFIALIVDQGIDPNEANYGILPLPNLETKVVAADTLLGFRPGQLRLDDEGMRRLEDELKQVRHGYFTVRRYRDKKALRARDRELCADLARMLADSGGFTPYDTQRIAEWNPYHTNTHASFFDSAWMFGLHPAGDQDGGVFDIVIGNPPYVRQEQLRGVTVTGSDGQPRPLKEAFKERYACYAGTADLYVYFFERSLQLLRVGGVLSFITSNKYMRAAYGEKLRAYLAYASHPHAILDFGDAPVFTSIAYPCILIAEKGRHVGYRQLPDPATFNQAGRVEQLLGEPDRTVRVHTWNPGKDVRDLPNAFEGQAHMLAQRDLKPDGWRLERPVSLRLLERLRQAGQPLGEYVQGRFYYGIKTGLNKAFVVDRDTRDRLIAEHPSSAEVLKPFLRGRDVKRWRCEFAERYLIRIESSENVPHPWSGKVQMEAEHLFAKTYPAIHAWFQPMRQALINRYDQGHYFWELRSCDYWREFEVPKVIYPDIYEHQSFAWDTDGFYSGNTTYFIPIRQKWLVALLNSGSIEWFYSQISNRVRGGYLRAFSDYMQHVPIPPAAPEQCRWCERLAEALIWLHGQTTARKASSAPVASMRAYFEQWLNALVYELFFPDELHGRKLTLFEETARLNPPDLSTIPEPQKLARLHELFEQAYDSHATLRSLLFSLRSLELVRIIEEPLERSATTTQDREP
jgi:adenine-specific DNA-methyltransferase